MGISEKWKKKLLINTIRISAMEVNIINQESFPLLPTSGISLSTEKNNDADKRFIMGDGVKSAEIRKYRKLFQFHSSHTCFVILLTNSLYLSSTTTFLIANLEQ